jgi:hypothetical protein
VPGQGADREVDRDAEGDQQDPEADDAELSALGAHEHEHAADVDRQQTAAATC